MAVRFTNNASATLASSITNVATSISLSAGQGALFPSLAGSDFFFATLVDASNNIEIVRVTARVGDTLTVTRGQDNTTARAYAAGDRIECRVTAAGLANKADLDGATFTGALASTNRIDVNVAGGTGVVRATGNSTVTAFLFGSSTGSIGAVGTETNHPFHFYINNATQGNIDTSGNLTITGNITSNSDERLKFNWTHVQPDFVAKLASVKSGIYQRVDKDIKQAGVSAQSLQALLPETVLADEDGMLSVSYGNAALVAAIELAKEVVALKAEVQALKSNKE